MEFLIGFILILVLWISLDVLRTYYKVKHLESELKIVSDNLETLITFMNTDLYDYVVKNKK